MSFSKEKEFLIRLENSTEFNKRIAISPEVATQIATNFPNIPKDYIDYLLEIGSGIIREMQFDVKDFLFDFNDLGLDDIYQLDSNIKFFGDNLSGDFAGFDLSKPNTDEVLEFWHDSNKLFYTGKKFRQYIREKMLMSE